MLVYFKSQFVEMFKNCDKVRLSEIANITMGQSPSSESYNDIGNGLPFFQGKADYGDKYTIVKYWTNQPSKLSYKALDSLKNSGLKIRFFVL